MKIKEIISIDIQAITRDHADYITETHINGIVELLFHILNLYPPHAKVEKSKKPLRIKNLTWLIGYGHYKLIQDIMDILQLYKEADGVLKKSHSMACYYKSCYYKSCIELLFFLLVTTSEGADSLKDLLKNNKSRVGYFRLNTRYFLELKVRFYKLFQGVNNEKD